MRLPDGSVLMHGDAPYDPAKAHLYYEQHKHLHPRAKGSGTYTVNRGGGKKVTLTGKQLTEEKAYAGHRVSAIKDRLKNLTEELHKKMAEAHKKPTAADKHAQAKASKKYADKHKQQIANKAKAEASKHKTVGGTPAKKSASSGSSSSSSKTHKSTTVEGLKKEIVTTKANLKAAVAKQRQLASATRNG